MNEISDINAEMRTGHPHLEDAERVFLPLIEARIRAYGRPARIFELGCASGLLTTAILERFPNVAIVAHEELPELIELARTRLAGTRAELYTGSFSAWQQPIDILVSGGSHHHLPHGYLAHANRLIVPGGFYLMGDEFCPEYLSGAHAKRVSESELLHFARGYVLTTAAEVSAYESGGAIPPAAIGAERLRKRALWHWYRFVVDHAMERGCFQVAIEELKSTYNDLITGSEEEHKYCPLIFERQMTLAGFEEVSKHVVGPPQDPTLQSFILYEYRKPVRPS